MRSHNRRMEEYGKIDLHLHLDGSLSAETILKLAGREHAKLPADTPEGLRPYLTVKIDCGSLNEYLKCFDIPLAVLRTAENLELAAYELGVRLSKKGISYGEIRFAPQLHCQNGLTQEEAVRAVLAGLDRASIESRLGKREKGIGLRMRRIWRLYGWLPVIWEWELLQLTWRAPKPCTLPVTMRRSFGMHEVLACPSPSMRGKRLGQRASGKRWNLALCGLDTEFVRQRMRG